MRVQGEGIEYQATRRKVRQGCAMSPDLYNLYAGEMILRELQGLEGVKNGGYNINHIRYADTVLVTDSIEKLQHPLDVTVRPRCWWYIKQMHPE